MEKHTDKTDSGRKATQDSDQPSWWSSWLPTAFGGSIPSNQSATPTDETLPQYEDASENRLPANVYRPVTCLPGRHRKRAARRYPAEASGETRWSEAAAAAAFSSPADSSSILPSHSQSSQGCSTGNPSKA